MFDTRRSLPPGQVLEEFRARRTRQWLASLPDFLAFLTFHGDLGADDGPLASLPLLAVILIVLGYAAFTVMNWRCPVCDSYLGKTMNPATCNRCGAKLHETGAA